MKRTVALLGALLTLVLVWQHDGELGPREAESKVRVRSPYKRPRPPALELGQGVLPGEFEPVEQVLFTWDPSLADFYSAAIDAIGNQARIVFVVEEWEQAEITDALDERGTDTKHVSFVDGEADTVWMRDYGPLMLRGPSGSRWVVDFQYTERPKDDALPRKVSPLLWPGRRVISAPMKLEGGNLLSDGTGRCVATSFIYELEHGRYSQARVRQLLRTYAGCRQLVVLPQLMGEPTGHVDMFVALPGPGKAVVGTYDPEEDQDNAMVADEAAALLRQAGFSVSRIRMPPNKDGKYRSYTNLLVVNEVVLVPTYNEDVDLEREALEAIASAYPGRTIVPIDSTTIIDLDGAIHCAAITIPR